MRKRQRDNKGPKDSPSPESEPKKVTIRPPIKSKMDEAIFRKILGEELDKRFQKYDDLALLSEQNSKEIQSLKNRIDYLELESKKKNIIVHGIPESTGKETFLERGKIFEDLISKLGLTDICYDEVRRLGLSNPSRPRPLLVKLVKLKDKFCIMQAKKNLKGQKIFINYDLPPEERKKNGLLRQFLNQRKKDDNGVTGFVTNGLLKTWKGTRLKQFKFDPNTGGVVDFQPLSIMTF
jgi:hypothetical protein